MQQLDGAWSLCRECLSSCMHTCLMWRVARRHLCICRNGALHMPRPPQCVRRDSLRPGGVKHPGVGVRACACAPSSHTASLSRQPGSVHDQLTLQQLSTAWRRHRLCLWHTVLAMGSPSALHATWRSLGSSKLSTALLCAAREQL